MNTEGRDLSIARSHYAALYAAADTYLARIAELEAQLAEANKRADAADEALVVVHGGIRKALNAYYIAKQEANRA